MYVLIKINKSRPAHKTGFTSRGKLHQDSVRFTQILVLWQFPIFIIEPFELESGNLVEAPL